MSNKYRHDLGYVKKMTNATDGYLVIKRQADIDEPFMNPDELTGSLLFFTRQGGYDYNNPESGAEARAKKICDAYNNFDELKKDNADILEALGKLLEATGKYLDVKKNWDFTLLHAEIMTLRHNLKNK